ncbi:claudin-10a [Myxocyprinus asiaticus]|uniref:claudin-10a n=1 Tax=Myxocyprinus asiaticus TaxID=70543 RepID=UPI0022224B7C|nr:claudin-10a [Myxocyprinus asiaticus]
MANMMTEIVAFLFTISGWVLISSTLPTDYWKVSSVDGTVITTATFWSNLWKTCVTDSTGVSNCKDFPSMLALDAYIQVCRGLMISAVCLGFFGAILALVGMKCTKIGGSETTKARITCLSGLHFILSGICSMTACSLYAHRITSEFFDPLFVKQKFELGAALFIGWSGSVLGIVGGFIFCFSMIEGFKIREYSYNGATSFISTRNKVTKTNKNSEALQKDPSEQIFSGRQFGRNAYV